MSLLKLIEQLERLCFKLNFHSRKKTGKIVLLRLDALGDFILWQDSAKEFKKKYPGTKIIVVCREFIAGFAETLPYFDEVCKIDINRLQQSFTYFLLVFFKMQCYRGAIVIQTVYSRTWLMDVVSAMIPAYKKISVDGNDDNYPSYREWRNAIYDTVRPVSPEYCFELCRNAEFMRRLGFAGFKSGLPILPEYAGLNNRLKEKYYVIVLGTSNYAKEWNPEYYGAVARFVTDKYHLQCCLLGTEKDKVQARLFKKAYKRQYIDLIGKTSIPEYIQIIRKAELVVSGDTSAAHIAASVRTYSVVIGGGWHYGRFFPYHMEIEEDKKYFPRLCCYKMNCYGCNRKHVTKQCRLDEKRTGKWSCILAVTPEIVVKKIEKIFDV